MLPSPPSEMEAKTYYGGLPSVPVLVARTGTTPWVPMYVDPMDVGYTVRVLKELHVVGHHALQEVWEDDLALKLHAILNSLDVKWTSTDVVRIGIAEEPPSSAPVILWIGVMPASLVRDDGIVVAAKCRELLLEYDITDVDVEIRESVAMRTAGPALLESTLFTGRMLDVREPLTTSLGLPISAQSTPWAEGTGGFFIAEGEDAKRLLLVTARHVVFPDTSQNIHYEHQNSTQHCHNVTLFGEVGFRKYLQFIEDQIQHSKIRISYGEDRIAYIEQRDDPALAEKLALTRAELVQEMKFAEELRLFYDDVETRWNTPESRTLGHIVLSPPIQVGAGSDGYTQDWAVIEVDPAKINPRNFEGNAIGLGTSMPIYELTRMMSPNQQPPYTFKYTIDYLLKLQGMIPATEMGDPTPLGGNTESCLMVLKRGSASGLTVGRANNIVSYARYYHDGKPEVTSKQWPILPHNTKSGPFSKKGDSGAVVADGDGRMGGLLTGGTGLPLLDISYATPVSFILQCMKDAGLHPSLNLDLIAQA